MTAWTRHGDIKSRLKKKWDQGHFLGLSVQPEGFSPLRIPIKGPTAKELTHEFEAARNWVAGIRSHPGAETATGFDVEWKQVNHRTLGKNKIPRALVFNTVEALAAYLDKKGQLARYQKLFQYISARFPELSGLLIKRPMDILAHDRDWDRLLAVAQWVRNNPRPGIYLRQLEIPGVDTKFMEARKAWLARMLDELLPPEAIEMDATGKAGFERRFGFRPKPARIRFRILDLTLSNLGLSDLEIPAADFYGLSIEPDIVFIVENEITGLSFPTFPGAVVIIGLGYGLSVLSKTPWMQGVPIWYWGDLDTHGFAMLDQGRHHFPGTRSFLMDEATLLSHKLLWGKESSPTNRELPLLAPDEAGVYDGLRRNRHAPRLRLEQERISYSFIRRAMAHIQKGEK
ncbi:MAG: hypothetical protein HUN04_13570 [Desulfobacter sp.]|nr:MAG: hypothetical protein HUN04_13570 [Desulfobacter sp.]